MLYFLIGKDQISRKKHDSLIIITMVPFQIRRSKRIIVAGRGDNYSTHRFTHTNILSLSKMRKINTANSLIVDLQLERDGEYQIDVTTPTISC